MNDAVVTILVALVSAAAGYVLWAWQHRVRPWVTPLDFYESLHQWERVSVGKELVEASKGSVVVDDVKGPSPRLGVIGAASTAANLHLGEAEVHRETLEQGLDELRAATLPATQIQALQHLLSGSLSDMLVQAIVHGLSMPAPDPSGTTVLDFEEDPRQDDGCFVFTLPHGSLKFASDLNSRPAAMKGRLKPFVQLVAQLELDKLIAVFQGLGPFLQEQAVASETIERQTRPILQENTRWNCRLSVTNFGATPFVMFSDRAWILIEDKNTRPIRLEAEIFLLDSDGDWVRAKGIHLAQPGTTQDVAVVTVDAQKDMPSGHIVRALFEKGTALAGVELEVLGLASLGRQRLKSRRVPFRG